MDFVVALYGYKKLMVEKTSGSGELDRKFYDADALEFQLQYNQLYLDDNGNYNAVDMFAHHHDAAVVNRYIELLQNLMISRLKLKF
jgi:nitrite reductase (NO-forming)